MGIVARDLGIDLGTSNTLVYARGKGILISEPTIVVVEDSRKRRILAVGEEAREMLGRSTEGILAVRPMREGVITDYDLTQAMIRYFIRKAIGSSYLIRPKVFLSYPNVVDAIEKRALKEAARNAGCRQVSLCGKAFLSALGGGIPVYGSTGCMVVDVGGGTTDVAVLSLGGVVVQRSVRVGGIKMDEAIVDHIRRTYNIEIGDRTAEEVKLDLGAALPLSKDRHARVRGRDVITNLPRTIEISSTDVYNAIHEICIAILENVHEVLKRIPPELAADIMHNGIYLMGGGAQLYGLDQLLASELGIPVLLAVKPMECTVQGLGNVIDNYDELKRQGRTGFLEEN